MYTTDRNVIAKYADSVLQEAGLFLAAAAFCALFAGIYELFSHGVYSYFMIFSFAAPLMLGAIPLLGIAAYAKRTAGEDRRQEEAAEAGEAYIGSDAEEMYAERFLMETAEAGEAYTGDARGELRGGGICFPGRIARNAWYSGIAALTVGCIFRGVLEIYGTTNRLLTVYFAAAGILMAIAVLSFLVTLVVMKKNKYHETETDFL